jgi:hypothetical protein
MNAELIMMLAIAITQALVVGLLVVPAIEQQVDAAPKQGPLGTK